MTEPATKAVPAIAEQPESLLAVIARAASDPSVDIDKMDRLLQMQERLEQRSAEADFNEAMSASQAEMGRIKTNKDNSQTKSKYADYAALDRVLRPIYIKHGFALSFDTETGGDGYIMVVAHVSRGRFSRDYRAPMPTDGKGPQGNAVMSKTHATGAAMTYGMRYLLKMIFNVAIGEDDTDGNMPGATITEEQANELKDALEEAATATGGEYGPWLTAFLADRKVEAIIDIQTKDFDRAKASIANAVKMRKTQK